LEKLNPDFEEFMFDLLNNHKYNDYKLFQLIVYNTNEIISEGDFL